MAEPRRRRETWLPYLCLGVTALLTFTILPSVLRPPPDQATSSAALSPDAPDEDEPDAIISSFQQAGSATAGAQRSSPVEAPTTTQTTSVPPPAPRASRGLCFGDPARQFQSVYAPDCQPAFVGDNGGATYKNVTADEIRIGFWHSLSMPSERGPIPDEPPENEGAAMRTHRVLQEYWRENVETYGRRIQLVAIENGSGDEGLRAAAAQADEEWGVFVSTHLQPPFCDELVRRGLVCYTGDPASTATLDDAAPHWWSFQMQTDVNERLVAEFVCNQLVGRSAEYAGGAEQGRPRRFGVVFESSIATGFRTPDDFAAEVRRRCDLDIETASVGNPVDNPDAVRQIADTIARFRLAGVTTIVNYTGLLSWLPMLQSADSSGYYPEWVLSGEYGIDFNTIGAASPQGQMAHAFGFTGWLLARPFPQWECYAAYKTIDPDNDPDQSVCNLFFHRIMQVLVGIQKAGPNLTPETFRQGMYEYDNGAPETAFSYEGGYGPGDHAFIDAMGVIWWDVSATNPENGAPGAFRWVRDAQRFGIGEIPEEPLPLFEEGVVGVDG